MKELLRKLICVETTAEKGELAAADIISAELGRSGIDTRIDSWDGNRANLIALVTAERAVAGEVKSGLRLSPSAVNSGPNCSAERPGRKNALLFACHLDVVGPGEADWEKPAFAGVESDGKIYGRGSADMKGGIAAVVTAVRQIVDSGTKLQGDIILFAAAGEESDSCGAKRFIHDRSGRLPRRKVSCGQLAGVVIPEPTDFEIVTTHRGLLWLKVTTKGKATHGSTPELGVNAIASMKSVLDELDNYEIAFEPHPPAFLRKQEGGGECSMSVNTIAGGGAINVVPDKCSIGIDIRTVQGQNHQWIISDFEKIFSKLKRKNSQFEVEVSIVREVGALETDNNCSFIKDFCSAVGTDETKAVGFTTDGPYFASLGAPVVVFGPGKGELVHKPDEYIEITDVEKAIEYYKNIILKFLA